MSNLQQKLQPYKNDIISKYNNGYDSRKLGKIYNCDKKTIITFLKKNNIVIKKSPIGINKYTVNNNYFSKIDTENKAYILGFLYADGYISYHARGYSVGINLSEKDTKILYDIKNELQYTGPISNIPEKIINNRNNKSQSRLRIYNKQLYFDLYNKGCVPNKSLILNFPNPNIISSNLMSSFIRGYFDGDGSFGCYPTRNQYRIHIVSSINFIENLSTFLKYHLYTHCYTYLPKNKNYSVLCLSKKIDVLNFLNYIYNNLNQNSLYLERKYNQYQEAIKLKYLEY